MTGAGLTPAVVYFSDDPRHDARRANHLLDLGRRVLVVPNRYRLTDSAAGYLFERYHRPGKSACVIVTGEPITSGIEAGDLAVSERGLITRA